MSPFGLALAAAAGVGTALVVSKTSAADMSSVGDSSDDASPVTSDDGSSAAITYADPQVNLDALLDSLLMAESSGDYGAMIGGTRTSDLSHHPAFTDATNTVRTAWAGAQNSHAAGGWQFQPATWKAVAGKLGLRDFQPDTQRAGAIELIKQRGAYDDVLSGDFNAALYKLRPEWASIDARGASWFLASISDKGGTA